MSDREFKIHPDMVGRLRRRGSAMVADNATIVGDVTLGKDVGIWFGVTIRGDDACIRIGARSNIQDNTVVHVDCDAPLEMGEGVTVGHGVIMHAVEVGDFSLVGMGAVVLGGARIGKNCILAAGTLVNENSVIPDGSVVMGVPGKIRRPVTEEEKEAMRWRADHYVERARSYLDPEESKTHTDETSFL